jgi:hypothetical protein
MNIAWNFTVCLLHIVQLMIKERYVFGHTACMSKVSSVEEIYAGETHGKLAYPGRSKTLCSSPKCRDWPWDPPNLLFNGNQGSFLEIRQSGCEAGG